MPPSYIKGVLKSFDPQTYRAAVQLIGKYAGTVTDLVVSRSIPASEPLEARQVAVAIFSPTRPAGRLRSRRFQAPH